MTAVQTLKSQFSPSDGRTIERRPAPKKVLYVIDTLEVGGSERSLLQIAEHLDPVRYRLMVCHLYRGQTLRPQFEALGVPVHSLDLSGKYRFASAFRKLRRVVLDERPDLLHTTLFRANQVGRAVGRWMNVPVISSFVNLSYDPARLAHDRHVRPGKLSVLKKLDTFTARWVTRFHSLSQSLGDSNCRHLGVDPQPVTIVPRGRDPIDFRPVSQVVVGELKQRLGVDDAFPLVLNVGRLVPQKAQAVLIEAMREVVAVHPRAKLMIAGDGMLRDELQTLAKRLGVAGHVLFLGIRNDVPQLLQAADCFAFPSRYEGLPGSVVEAMFAGCPVVATDIPVIHEVVDSDQTGLLVPPNDVAALAAAINRLARDRELAEDLSANAGRTAIQRFDIHTVAAQTMDMYGSVLEEWSNRVS